MGHSTSAAPFENGMLTLLVHLRLRPRGQSLEHEILANMSRSEAERQRHEDADYPGRYLTPISVHMAYSYLSCSGYRLICLFAHGDSLAGHRLFALGAIYMVGGRQQVPTSNFEVEQ